MRAQHHPSLFPITCLVIKKRGGGIRKRSRWWLWFGVGEGKVVEEGGIGGVWELTFTHHPIPSPSRLDITEFTWESPVWTSPSSPVYHLCAFPRPSLTFILCTWGKMNSVMEILIHTHCLIMSAAEADCAKSRVKKQHPLNTWPRQVKLGHWLKVIMYMRKMLIAVGLCGGKGGVETWTYIPQLIN